MMIAAGGRGRRNVIILMQSRTASSLVAATFRAHGWQSNAEKVRSQTNSGGYVTHENLTIRKHLVGQYGTAMPNPLPPLAAPDSKLQQIVMGQFGTWPPWLWKGDAYYFEAFKASFEDLAIVYVKRFIPDAIASSLDMRTLPKAMYAKKADELASFLRTKYDYMVDLEIEHGGKVVYTTDVLKGRFDTLRNAIEYAGRDWDEDLVRQVMERRG